SAGRGEEWGDMSLQYLPPSQARGAHPSGWVGSARSGAATRSGTVTGAVVTSTRSPSTTTVTGPAPSTTARVVPAVVVSTRRTAPRHVTWKRVRVMPDGSSGAS